MRLESHVGVHVDDCPLRAAVAQNYLGQLFLMVRHAQQHLALMMTSVSVV